MKNVIRVIDAKRKAAEMTSKEMACRLDLPESALSRWRANLNKDMKPETILKIQASVHDDPVFQADLLAGFLRDKCIGPAAGRILIEVIHESEKMAEKSPEVQDDYAILANKARLHNLDKKMVAIFVCLIQEVSRLKWLRQVLQSLAQGFKSAGGEQC